jgi:hypothetical protein
MIYLIWTLPILAITLPLIWAEVNFRKQVKQLNEEFYKELKLIDRLEESIMGK